MHPLRALFFDFSGTLIDETADRIAHTDLVRRFLEKHKLVEDLDRMSAAFERHLSEQYHRTLESSSFVSLAELHAQALDQLLMQDILNGELRHDLKFDSVEFGSLSNRLHVMYSTLFDGAHAALRAGHELGLHVGIISDYDEMPLKAMIEKFNLAGLVDSVISSEAVGVYKPESKIFQAGLSEAGCRPEEAIYVGDRWERDIVGAKRVGMLSVLVGFDPAGRPPPDYTIEKIIDLPGLLAEIVSDGR